MKLVDFKNKLSTNGLARNNTWELNLFTPASISKASESLFGTQNVSNPGDFGADRSGFISDAGIERQTNDGKALNYPNISNTLVNTGDLMRDLTLYANACSLPSRDMQNVEFREYGEKRALGFNQTHKDLMITFYCSEDLRERAFFELWQDSIFNPRNKQITYYKDYVSNLLITKYSTGWKHKMGIYKFQEVYPTNVGGMPLNFEGNQVLRLDVTFKYRNYERIQ